MNVRSLVSFMVAVVIVVMTVAGIGSVAVAAPAGSITGTVTDDTGTPMAGARVVAWDWDDLTFEGQDYTNADGVYSITGLRSDTYRVRAYADGYYAYYYDGAFTVPESTPVSVTDPYATTGIDFSLDPAPFISGHVYQEDGVTPIDGAWVSVYENITDSGSWKWMAGATTDTGGFYSITAFAGNGNYKVKAESKGWAAEYYDNVTTLETATPVVVAGGNVTDIDFDLTQIGCISGTVYDGDGVTPLGGVTITARDNATQDWMGYTRSDEVTGFYYINLPPGTYRIQATCSGYISQWWENAATFADATPISVVGVDETPNKNFTMLTVPAVETKAATSILTTSAVLNGDLTSMGANDNVTVSFEWDTDSVEPYANETPGQVVTATGPFSFTLSGLTKDTPYYFRAKAVGNVDPTPFYGGQMSFTTGVEQPSVTTSAASNLAVGSATLNGNLTSLGTASTVDVYFQWGTDTSYGSTTTPQPMTAAGAFSDNITGLTPNTLYHFRSVADGDGDPVYGEDMTFTALGAAPTVTTGAATSVAATTATLNGNLTSLGTASSVIVSFEWGTTDGGPYSNVTDNQTMTGTGTFSANVTGLVAGTTYYYRAKAVGDGTALGDQVSFTASVTPPTVTTGAASNLAATSATLNGNLASLGTAGSVAVSFEWGTSTSYGSETTAQSLTAAGAFTANLTDLTANTTYHFRAKAVGDGAPAYGEDVTFTTAALPDTAAPVISQVSASDVTKSGATITWITNEPATSRVEYGLTDEYGSFTPLATNLVTSHSVEITGLKAGKTYHFRVISKDASSNEAMSSDFTFETASKSGGGVPVWAWVLIGIAVVAVAAGAGYFAFTKMGKQS
ncbi:MAG: carboxypeptidase regulatory-like domain-containing protein [Dehalococcoidia bacterium]|nr:carboxypeptidase regulatory-like domain-containing protein [Dehalococcoidia bacterium]